MHVTLVADSTFLFETAGLRILTDPWIGTTIYGGAWQQYPPPVISATQVGRLDYIFISHIHEDHCDPATLAQLDRNAVVLLMERTPNFVAQFLKRQGLAFRDVRNIAPFTRYVLSDNLAVEVIDADPEHELNHLIDSSLVLHAENGSVYFANDNPPYAAATRHLQQYRFDLALLPASGGSGYPACYGNLSPQQKAAEQARIQAQYLDTFVATIEALRPRRFAASAGNHIIAGRHADLNAAMTFLPSPMTAYRYASEHLSAAARDSCLPLLLKEGESWDSADSGIPASQTAWTEATQGEREYLAAKARYIADVARRSPYAHDGITVPADCNWEDLFKRSADHMLAAVQRNALPVRTRLYVRLGGPQASSWGVVDCAAGSAGLARASDFTPPFLAIACDAPLLYLLLNNRFSWNIADAAGFLEYQRVPNDYDRFVYIAVNYLHL